MCRYAILLFVLASVGTARGQVFSSEFFSDPISEEWERVQQYCDPETWVNHGLYYQRLGFPSCEPPGGGQDSYVRWITEYNGQPQFFLEFRLETDGDRSEIPGGAPTVVATGNFFGISYNSTVARDQVKLLRDVDLPILFFDLEPEMPHTIRLELYNGETSTYRWYIDGEIVDEGLAEGPYPSNDARIAWRGKAWYLSCHNAWDYIRYGVIPEDGSGDYDSDGDVDFDDFYFFQEYFSGTDVEAGPGGRWADFDADTDVDCDDWEAFKLAWTDPGDPPLLIPCDGPAIPTVSQWGVIVMTLLTLTTGTIVFRRDGVSSFPRSFE